MRLPLTGFLLLILAVTWLQSSASIKDSSIKFYLILENRKGGRILLSEEALGRNLPPNTCILGKVERPATDVRTQSFRASAYGTGSVVVASAVNAIHIKIYTQSYLGRGATISIFPKELYGFNLKGEPDRLLDYVIYTDVQTGRYLFGGSFSPIPGSAVRVIRNAKSEKLGFGYIPKVGDILEIEVSIPLNHLKKITFENKEKGRVYAFYQDGVKKVIATVAKPITGVGRFDGSILAPVGSIRAVHSGVIEISTSRRGQIGGFQITSVSHTMAGSLVRALIRPQYLLLLPTKDEILEGTPPLFRDYLFPRVNDVEEPDVRTISNQTISVEKIPHLPKIAVFGDFGRGLEPLPVCEGRNDNALIGLKELIISFYYDS